jgi:polysaccharide biosynthesis protein PslH
LKILIVTSALPYPAASGGALRVAGIVQGLLNAQHEVTLASFHDEPLPTLPSQLNIITHPTPTRSRNQRIKTLLLSQRADIQERLWSESFFQQLVTAHTQESFDIIQFEGIEMACYLLPFVAYKKHAKLIFDTFNAEADLQRMIYEIERQTLKRLPQAMYSWLQAKRIATYEQQLCEQADKTLVVSEEDAEILVRYPIKRTYPIIASGITVSDYTQNNACKPLGERTLVFTGKMDYRPNIDAMLWFCEQILPKLPNTRLVIVGQKPVSSIQTLTQKYPVEITGWVDSVVPYLRGATVYIAPLRMGSGTRLKILEALACGCAIIATPLAAAGLNEPVLQTMKIAEHANDFANAVLNLLDNAPHRAELGQKAIVAVRDSYDWGVIIPRLLNVYGELNHG